MEQLDVINKIKSQEEEAQQIIEKAKLKSSSIIQEVRLVKKNELIKKAQDEAAQETQRLKEEFKRKTEEALSQIDYKTKQEIDKIKELSIKNKGKTRDYIVNEVLKLWQLPGSNT